MELAGAVIAKTILAVAKKISASTSRNIAQVMKAQKLGPMTKISLRLSKKMSSLGNSFNRKVRAAVKIALQKVRKVVKKRKKVTKKLKTPLADAKVNSWVTSLAKKAFKPKKA